MTAKDRYEQERKAQPDQPMPDWDKLSQEERAGWQRVADAEAFETLIAPAPPKLPKKTGGK